MAYCTLVDLKNYTSRDILQQLTDDNNNDEIDQEKVDFAIGQASDLIDGYINGRYTLPLTTVPAMILDVAVKLSIYFLYKRSLTLTLPDPIKDDYDEGMHILRDVQRGRCNPFPVAQNPMWFLSNKASGSQSVVQTATNDWNDYLVRTSTSSSTRFLSPGSL